MTLQGSGGAGAFSDSAAAYAATMAPSLRHMAQRVVDRASLGPSERVLDLGTGTGTAAAMARGGGRRVVGLDAAPGMLEIARADNPDLELVEASFDAIPFDDGEFDVVLAVHALHFADDPIAALREWRRVSAPGGRLSLSVPGPAEVVPMSIFGDVLDRYDIGWGTDYPTPEDVTTWAETAGWAAVATSVDPTTVIALTDDAAFRRWLTVGARGRATAEWSEERKHAFADDLMAVTPRDDAGGYRVPFGTIYLTAEHR